MRAAICGLPRSFANTPAQLDAANRQRILRRARRRAGKRRHSAAAGTATGISCGSTTERSGSSQKAHTAAPATSRAADKTNGAAQFSYWAKNPNTKGDSAPPILPAMFIIPDTVPEYLPPQSMGTAHAGPIVHSRKNMAAAGMTEDAYTAVYFLTAALFFLEGTNRPPRA